MSWIYAEIEGERIKLSEADKKLLKEQIKKQKANIQSNAKKLEQALQRKPVMPLVKK
jgi:hypothetical protein